MPTVGESYLRFKNLLAQIYEIPEAEQVTIMLFEDIMEYNRMEIFRNEKKVLSRIQETSLEKLLMEVLTGKPIQYVLGYSWFYGMKLVVNENVLIPRQETEELVQWLIDDVKLSGKVPSVIVDYCTGSGCIALALKRKFPDTRTIAIDDSEPALKVAKVNALKELLEIEIINDNALSPKNFFSAEIIVSNPPYVLQSEKDKMHDRVLQYEPSSALFVSDDDALLFYRHIADWGKKNLLSGGKIYFEINERMGEEITQLHLQLGYSNPEIKKDLQGKSRMFRATWK